MKKFVIYILSIISLLITSCNIYDLDNYGAPDSIFHGQVIDKETGDTIQQELILGSVIEYVELGFENPQIQQLRFHTKGTFRNNLMFSGEYTVQPVRGNFFIPEVDTIRIEDITEYTFKTLPYLRIKDVVIEMHPTGKYVIGKFKIEQVSGEKVRNIALAAGDGPDIGITLQTTGYIKGINKVVDPTKEFVTGVLSNDFENGKTYYFRVGALIDIPEAKYNWSKPIKFTVIY